MCSSEPLKQNMPSREAVAPKRMCETCNGWMEHLADLRQAGAQPAKRIFLCRACRNLVSELQ
jgi:hypothetical protein